jgi:hypothetical protein
MGTVRQDSPAFQLMLALRSQQATLEHNLPKDSRLVATLILTTGTRYEVLAAHATEPDMIVFSARREGKTVAVIVRYDIVAEIVFHVEKGEPRPMGFHLKPPQAEPLRE